MVKIDWFKMITIALVYTGFFALLGFTVYFTNSAKPLWALLIAPSLSYVVKNNKGKKKDKNKEKVENTEISVD